MSESESIERITKILFLSDKLWFMLTQLIKSLIVK